MLRHLSRDSGYFEMVVLHDLGVAILMRLRALVYRDRATKRRERALAHLHTINDDRRHESQEISTY